MQTLCTSLQTLCIFLQTLCINRAQLADFLPRSGKGATYSLNVSLAMSVRPHSPKS